MQNQTIGQMQPIVHAQQLAMDGMAMSKDLGGLRCPGIIRGASRVRESPARDGCTTPIAGRLFYPPASTKELHDLMALGVRLR
jgi:hypothetical protein